MKDYVEHADCLGLLIQIGKMGGIRRPVFCTTSELGKMLGISQQSTSRKLTRMENDNLIVRHYTQRGNSIKITPEGSALLERIFKDLWLILNIEEREPTEKITLKGKIVTGMGEGAYYMNRKGYKHQLSVILGYTPFPGTLNLQILEEQSQKNFNRVLQSPSKYIPEFSEENRRFGKVFVWPTYLLIGDKKVDSAIIRPDRTHHTNQIELIAEHHIKTTYNVKDGDEIIVVLK
ncbi:MAG: DUF120 domain-containing protein [Candidatus Hodarchaeales archaeon]